MIEYYESIYKCAERYQDLLKENLIGNDYWGWKRSTLDRVQVVELLEFIFSIKEEAAKKEIPLNKLNRWIGYVQGMLIAAKLTSVTVERDWTRPLFRPLDYPCKVDD